MKLVYQVQDKEQEELGEHVQDIVSGSTLQKWKGISKITKQLKFWKCL